MYHREWLRENIKQYLHDSSLDAQLDTFIDLGAKRVSQILECWEMEQTISNTIIVQGAVVVDGGSAGSSTDLILNGGNAFNSSSEAPPGNYIALPVGAKRILGVQVLDNDEWRNLRAVGRHEAGKYKGTGTALYYVVEGREIQPLPVMDGTYRAQILAEVEIPLLTEEVQALTSYPFIFLNAALSEAYDWKQNEVMAQRYEQKFVIEAREVSDNYRNARGGEVLSVRAS